MPKISQQAARRFEDIGRFNHADMFMIALARLIVIAQYTHAINHKRQAVLESMATAGRRGRQTPQDQFGKTIFALLEPFSGQ